MLATPGPNSYVITSELERRANAGGSGWRVKKAACGGHPLLQQVSESLSAVGLEPRRNTGLHMPRGHKQFAHQGRGRVSAGRDRPSDALPIDGAANRMKNITGQNGHVLHTHRRCHEKRDPLRINVSGKAAQAPRGAERGTPLQHECY